MNKIIANAYAEDLARRAAARRAQAIAQDPRADVASIHAAANRAVVANLKGSH